MHLKRVKSRRLSSESLLILGYILETWINVQFELLGYLKDAWSVSNVKAHLPIRHIMVIMADIASFAVPSCMGQRLD
jgi:hypothetical protein